MEGGWQIGVYRHCPRCGGVRGQPGCGKLIHDTIDNESEAATDKAAIAALYYNNMGPVEVVDSGVYIASIPEVWAQQAQDEGLSEPGQLIQECNQHVITDRYGDEWVVEVPMP